MLRFKSQLTNRWTAKGDTFYAYDPGGNLTNVNYPGTVMDIALQHDPLDRLTNVVDAVGTTRFAGSPAGSWGAETFPYANLRRLASVSTRSHRSHRVWPASLPAAGVQFGIRQFPGLFA